MDKADIEKMRVNDRFMRKLLWTVVSAFITVVIMAGSGFFVLYGDVQANKVRIEEFLTTSTRLIRQAEDDHKTMQSIEVLMHTLVAKATSREEKQDRQIRLQEAYSEKLMVVFGEQQRRKTAIDSVFPHIHNRSIHK